MNHDMQRIIEILAHNAWVMLRLSGFMLTAPVLSNALVSVRIRVVLLLALTVLIGPLVSANSTAFAFDGASMLAVANELVLGAAIGFSVMIAFEALTMAGTLTAMTMGLGFASLIDPQHRGEEPVVGTLYQTLALLMYLSVDGHLALLAALAESFRLMPAGAGMLSHEALWSLALMGAKLFASGVVIALPAVVALLIVNVALGVVSRAAPQLNLYAVGFPVSMVFGLLVLMQALPLLRQAFETLLRDALTQSSALSLAR